MNREQARDRGCLTYGGGLLLDFTVQPSLRAGNPLCITHYVP